MKKTCFKCGMEKPIEEFYTHPGMRDGHLNKCKECTKKDEKLRRIMYPEKMSAYERSRTRPQWYMERNRYWRFQHPDRYKAQTMIGNAVRDGRIIKSKTCEICGSSSFIHAHHQDYSKPLEVVWLCAKCHGQIQ